jgi:alpha-N-arabinofuranosidase
MSPVRCQIYLLPALQAKEKITDQSTAQSAWHSVNGAELTVIAETIPVSSALPNALSVVVPRGATGQVGIGNEGYFGMLAHFLQSLLHSTKLCPGIKVNSSDTYSASFFYRFPTASSFRGTATVALQTSTGQILGATNVTLSGAQTSWLQINTTIKPTTTPESLTNNFTITVNGAAAAGQTIHFAMLSLFPPTFKNRPNGMRVDIAEVCKVYSSF